MQGLKSAILAIFQIWTGWQCPVCTALKNPSGAVHKLCHLKIVFWPPSTPLLYFLLNRVFFSKSAFPPYRDDIVYERPRIGHFIFQALILQHSFFFPKLVPAQPNDY